MKFFRKSLFAISLLAFGLFIAGCTVPQVTVNFETNGGNAIESIQAGQGMTATLPTPVRDGYVFEGWYLNSALTTSFDPATLLQDEITLYAKWTPGTYVLTLNTNGGVAINPMMLAFGAAVTLPTPFRDGYTFGGWYTTSALTTVATLTTMPAASVEVFAKWLVDPYTISFDSNEGSQPDPVVLDFDATIPTLPTPTKVGYAFAGWFLDPLLTQPMNLTKMPSQNFTVYAKWTINQFTMSFNSNGGSAVAPITKDYMALLSSPHPTKSGYTFGGWHSDIDLTVRYVISTMPAANITLYAKWNINTYQVIFQTNGGSVVASLPVVYDEVYTLPDTIPTKNGYTFAGWYADVALTTIADGGIMPASNVTVYAKWTPNPYTITFNTNGGSAITPITQDYMTEVVAPAAPTRGSYVFAGWFSDVELTQAYTFATMPAENITVYAKWTINYALEITIPQALALTNGTDMIVSGIITNVIGRSLFLTDGTNAFYAYNVGPYDEDLIPGNEVLLVGKRDTYSGLPQVSSVTGFELLSEGNALPAPMVATSIAPLDLQPHISKLISIDMLTIKTIPTMGTGSFSVVLTDGTLDIPIRVDRYTSTFEAMKTYLATFVVGDMVQVVGMNVGWFNNPQLAMTKVEQLVNLSRTLVSPTVATMNAGDTALYGGKAYIVGKNAFATLKLAEDAIRANSVVYVDAGTYSDAFIIKQSNVTITGPNATFSPVTDLVNRVPEAIVTGIISNADGVENTTIEGLKFTGQGRIYSTIAWKHVTLKHNHFAGSPADVFHLHSLVVGTEFENITIVANFFEDTTMTSGRAIRMNNTRDVEIVGNKFVGFFDGIRFEGTNNTGINGALTASTGIGAAGVILIDHNTFTNFKQYPIGIYRYTATHIMIINNEFSELATSTTSFGIMNIQNAVHTGTKMVIDIMYNDFIAFGASGSNALRPQRYYALTADQLEININWNIFRFVPPTAFVNNGGTTNATNSLINAQNNYYAASLELLPTQFVGVSTYTPSFLVEADFNTALAQHLIDYPKAVEIAEFVADEYSGEIFFSQDVSDYIATHATLGGTIEYVGVGTNGAVFNAATGEFGLVFEDTQVAIKATVTVGAEVKTVIFNVTVKPLADPGTVLEARDTLVGEDVYFKGIVTAVIGTNAFVQDATAAIYVTGIPVGQQAGLVVGNEVAVMGKAAVANGLIQANQITVFAVMGTGKPLPDAMAITDWALEAVVANQGKLINAGPLTIVTIPSIGTGGYNVTVNNGTVDITIRVDAAVADFNAIKALFQSLKAGDVISIEKAPIGWFTNPQIALSSLAQITMTDAFKVAKVQAWLEEIDNSEVNMGSIMNFPLTHPVFGTSIIWLTTNENWAVIDVSTGYVSHVAEDKIVSLIAIIGLKQETYNLHLGVTVKHLDPLVEIVLYETGFEVGATSPKGSYTLGNVVLDGKEWALYDALIGNLADDKKEGTWSIRGRMNVADTPGYATMLFGYQNATKISFKYAHYGTLTQGLLSVQVSKNGTDWITIMTPTAGTAALQQVVLTLDYNHADLIAAEITAQSTVRFRFLFTGAVGNNSRMNLDEVKIYGFPTFVTPPEPTQFAIDHVTYADQAALEAVYWHRVPNATASHNDSHVSLAQEGILGHGAIKLEFGKHAVTGWDLFRTKNNIPSVPNQFGYFSFWIKGDGVVTNVYVWMYWVASQDSRLVDISHLPASGGYVYVPVSNWGKTPSEITQFAIGYNLLNTTTSGHIYVDNIRFVKNNPTA